MPVNLGKKFEARFSKDWINSMPDSDAERLYDPGFGMKGVHNICDFICYSYPFQYYMECKSIKGNTFPLSNLKQYDKLVTKQSIKGVRRGVVIWFIDHNKVIYAPIETIKKLKMDDKKSVNIKMLESSEYRLIDIPSIKKRTMMTSDYSILRSLNDGD